MMRPLGVFCVLLLLLTACGEDKAIDDPGGQTPDGGLVYGIVIDARTGQPIPGVTLTLADEQRQTDADGRYAFEGMTFGDALQIEAQMEGYETGRRTFDLRTTQLEIHIELPALVDPLQELQQFLDELQALIESDEPANIPEIQTKFAEEYTAADDPATQFGLLFAPIPATFEDVEPSILELFQEYDNILFSFQDREFDVPNATEAFVLLKLHLHTERGPRPDVSDIEVECELRFRKQEGEWVVTFWRLIELVNNQDA